SCQNGARARAQPIENIGAGEGNRTLVITLKGCCSTIELHPQRQSGVWALGTVPSCLLRNGGRPPPITAGSRLSLVGEVGLEPTKAKQADLQSAPFAARDTPPDSARVLKALQRAGQVRLCRFRDHSEQIFRALF